MIYVLGCILLFALMIAMPFLLGYKELTEKKDDKNLYVNRNYVRNPRYFGQSFRALLEKSKAEWEKAQEGTVIKIHLSKDELLNVEHNISAEPVAIDAMAMYMGNSVIAAKSGFQKEVYGQGTMEFGEGCWARAIATDGNLRLAHGCKVVRWLDVEGEGIIEDDAILGISASSGTSLQLGKNCSFKRLYAPKISVGISSDAVLTKAEQLAPTLPKPKFNEIEYNIEKIEPLEDKEKRPYGSFVFPKTIVMHKALTIKKDMIVLGNIKAKKDLIIEDNVVVLGNVFCEGVLTVGKGCVLGSVVFSQEDINLGPGTTVGSKGKLKSLIARGKITLAQGVTVYGYVLTDEGGKTL